MADTPIEGSAAAAPLSAPEQAPATEKKATEPESGGKEEADVDMDLSREESTSGAADAKPADSAENSGETPGTKEAQPQEVSTADTDLEMRDVAGDAPPLAADDDAAAATAPAAATGTPSAKGRGGRRKSSAGDTKGKTLGRKASKARLTHADAKPGQHFLVKLKGFPAWPAIICDESMLPPAIVNSRPVSAARPDGTYSDAYADGGKKAQDRSFPVMYLYTNEFGWINNTALTDLSVDKAKQALGDKMRKDLRAAFELAVEHHPVEHYKEILRKFNEEVIAHQEAQREAAATPKKARKGKAKAADEGDGDAEMSDAEVVDSAKSVRSRKRKAEDDTNTPQRSGSVKKPKIKLNTSSTPKTANGGAKHKSGGDSSASKGLKVQAKKTKGGNSGLKKTETSKESKMTAEERHARKEKEVLYLRHKLQRGLLTREQQPREDEMKTMSDFITMLENFADLEASIIRATKINKVLKAILKLNSIPREDEFQFKKRSQMLLDKWSKLLTGDASASASAATNGVNGSTDAAGSLKRSSSHGTAEGASGDSKKPEGKTPSGTKQASGEAKAKAVASEKDEAGEDLDPKSGSEAAAALSETVSAGAD